MNLLKLFRRPLPKNLVYERRLARELKLISNFGFEQVFEQARTILDLAEGVPHSTRGSAGCSLVCYLLGISDFDPVLNRCVLSRFMHEGRSDLPDIDVDFPYNFRDELIERVKRKYPGRVARISNKVKYTETTALRQAIRDYGRRRFLPKNFDLDAVAGSRKTEILSHAGTLLGNLQHYSLHCGGIVIFDGGVPEELKLSEDQVKLDKDDVDEHRLIKMDLLCNRGLAQLVELGMKDLDQYDPQDKATAEVFSSGKTLGVTFAESPALRKLFREAKPQSRDDIILALAMIRPAPAVDGRKARVIKQLHSVGHTRGHVVTDDDAIELIQEVTDCSESEAELYRKAFAKQDKNKMAEFAVRLGEHPIKDWLLHNLKYLALYSFCRGHSISLGRIAWALAAEKVRQPKKFWLAALNHCDSQYRPWVNVQEAKSAGLRFENFGRGPWTMQGDSLWCDQPDDKPGDGWKQFRRRGYWTSPRFIPGMVWDEQHGHVRFKALIGCGRHHTVYGRSVTYLTVGWQTGKFADLVVDHIFNYDGCDGVEGTARHLGGTSYAVESLMGWSVESKQSTPPLF